MRKILYVFLLVSFISCKERYFHLQKVKAAVRKGTMDVRIENKSPNFLSSDFQEGVERVCIKRMQDEGYRFTKVDPVYELFLEMEVDSSVTYGRAFVGPGPGYTYYSRRNKGLQMDMVVKHIKTGHTVWEDHYNLYFFGNEARDLSRAKGVIRYMISGMSNP